MMMMMTMMIDDDNEYIANTHMAHIFRVQLTTVKPTKNTFRSI